MLVNISTHGLSRIVVLSSAKLGFVLRQFKFDFLHFAQIYAVQEISSNDLSVIFDQVKHFFPKLAPIVIKQFLA